MNELELLARALGFIFVIGLGYTLKVKGIVRREDARIFSSLVMNITLPASLLVASATAQVSIDLYLPFILGILCNLFWIWWDTGKQRSLVNRLPSVLCSYQAIISEPLHSHLCKLFSAI